MDAQPEKLKPILAILQEGRPLTGAEATAAFEIILSGDATPSQIGAFLTALRLRGETVDEIAAIAARAARVQHMGRHFDLQRIGAHHADARSDIIHSFAAQPQV